MPNPRANNTAKPKRLAPFNLKLWPTMLDMLVFWLAVKRHTHITRTNLALCFPDLSPQALATLNKKTRQPNAIALIKIAVSRWASYSHIAPLIECGGLGHLEEICSRGKGILLLGNHFTHLDFLGRLFTMQHHASITIVPYESRC